LPINAGLGGFWPLLVLAVLAFPMTFYAHRGLTRFVLSGREGSDITEVVEEHFGIKAGALITLLYFFAIFPILLIYSVALTNTVGSFLEHQLHITPPPRAILSFVLILGLLAVPGGVPGSSLEWRHPQHRQHLARALGSAAHLVAGDSGDGVLVQPLANHFGVCR